MNFRIWPVTLRLYSKIGRKGNWPTKGRLIAWAAIMVAEYGDKYPGVYQKTEDGIMFVGFTATNWWGAVGFIPNYMPVADDKQPVPEGKTDWFEQKLKDDGFVEVEE